MAEAPKENPLLKIVAALENPLPASAEALNAAVKAKGQEIVAAARGQWSTMRDAINAWITAHGPAFQETEKTLTELRTKISSDEAVATLAEGAKAAGRLAVSGVEQGLVDTGTGLSALGKTAGSLASGTLPEATGHAVNAAQNLITPTIAALIGFPILRKIWKDAGTAPTFLGKTWGYLKALLGSAAVVTGGVLLYNTTKKGVDWAFGKGREYAKEKGIQIPDVAQASPSPAQPAASVGGATFRAPDESIERLAA